MNYYELFGYEPAPAVDISDLARRYFDLQRRYHPDRFATAGEEEKEEALRMSSAANEGFAIFRDSDKTLAYYLNYAGLLEEEEKFQLPSDFLMEMMELNEMAEEDKDGCRTAVDRLENELQSGIRDLLEKSKTSKPDNSDLQQLKLYHFKKKYLRRILDKLTD